jgi:hypothetical protein
VQGFGAHGIAVGAKAIRRKQPRRVGICRRQAGRNHLIRRVASADFLRYRTIEVEQLLQQVALGGKTVGGEHCRIEFGMGVAQRIPARQVERSVERAQATRHVLQGLVTNAADFAAGGGDGVDLLFARRLWPGEGVEDGTRSVVKALGQL